MPYRRHAADREPGLGADEVGVGAADPLAEQGGELGFVDAIDARGDGEHGPLRTLGAEDQRLGDLGDVQPIASAASAAVRVLASNSSTW